MDQLEKKVEGSQKREKSRNNRRRDWDEVNGIGKEERRKLVLGNGGAELDGDDDEWEDEPDPKVDLTAVAAGVESSKSQQERNDSQPGAIKRTMFGAGVDEIDAIS